MRTKTQRLRPYFGVGNKVQLKPVDRLTGAILEGLHGTIQRIEERPNLEFFAPETQEDYENFLRIRSVHFWIKLDDFPELHDYYKQNEVLFQYRELHPLQPKMGKQQLIQHCEKLMLKEHEEHHKDAYLGIVRYLNGQWPGWPLSSLDHFIPKGYYVDLINRFINGATNIRKLAQESRENNQMHRLTEKYEAQAQVLEELSLLLMPKTKALAYVTK